MSMDGTRSRPWLLALLLLVAGCGSDSDAPIAITYDRHVCDAEFADLTAGDHSFVVTNTSDRRVALYVVRLEDGRSYRDLIDLQDLLGGSPAYVSMPA